MSTWKVTIRTDEGHKKWASVEADDVAGAIVASGAEADAVRSVKIEDKKRPPVPAMIATLGLIAYVGAIWLEDWGAMFTVSDLRITLPLLALFGLTMFSMRKHFMPSSDGQSPVKWSENPMDERAELRWLELIGIWIMPFVAIFFGYEVITNMGGEEAISPDDVLTPIFWFGATLLVLLYD